MKYRDKISRLAIVRVAALILAASAGNAHALETGQLIGKWRAVTIAGWAVPEKFQVSISFGQRGEFRAVTGCNGIHGNYEVKEGKLVFLKTRITLKMCSAERMQVERRVSKMLHRRGSWQMNGDQLTATNASKDLTSQFERIGAN
ncbi:MAG: META domain-containing protein [Hyphomicrobiales bacterium]|nr:META domain-containing protein [Hyphomicrobiales bacterium]